MVEAIQQQRDGCIEFAKREELAVAQHRQDPAFDYLHADFDLGFVLGLARASRQDGDAVMLGQIAVAGVDIRLVTVRFSHATAQIIRHQDLHCAPKKAKHRTCEHSQSGSFCDQVASAKV